MWTLLPYELIKSLEKLRLANIRYQAKKYANTVHSRSVKEFWMIQTGLTTSMGEHRGISQEHHGVRVF